MTRNNYNLRNYAYIAHHGSDLAENFFRTTYVHVLLFYPVVSSSAFGPMRHDGFLEIFIKRKRDGGGGGGRGGGMRDKKKERTEVVF